MNWRPPREPGAAQQVLRQLLVRALLIRQWPVASSAGRPKTHGAFIQAAARSHRAPSALLWTFNVQQAGQRLLSQAQRLTPLREPVSFRGRVACRFAWHLVLRAGQLGADLPGLRVLQVLQDGECPLPGLPGLGQFIGGVECVTEAGQSVRCAEVVAELVADRERTLVTGDGFGEVAEMMLDVATVVPDDAVGGAGTAPCSW